MNGKWQPEFVCGEEITNKQFTIKDFAVYMNFSKDHKEILFEEITKDWGEMEETEKYKKFLR